MITLSPGELLRRHNIEYKATRSGNFTTDCPNCSGGGYLNVRVDNKGVAWFCHNCEHGGGDQFDQRESRDTGGGLGTPTAVYDYLGENGDRLFQVLRFDPVGQPKQFRQRTGPDQEKWSIKGVRIVPYRLPELLEDIGNDRTVFIVEGEKDVNGLRARGVPATCNPMGAGKWRADWSPIFAGADVVVCCDNDTPGRDHANQVAAMLSDVARRVRLLDLAEHWPNIQASDDVSDWFEAGGTVEHLWALVESLEEWRAPEVNGHDAAAPLQPIDAPASQWIDLEADFLEFETAPIPDREWGVRDRFPRDGVSLLSGEGGRGKSLLLLQLAIAHVTGRDWLKSMPEPGPAMLINCEDDRNEIARRMVPILAQQGATFGSVARDLHVYPLVGRGNNFSPVLARPDRAGVLQPTDLYRGLLARVREIKPICLSIDNVADVFGGNEIDRTQVRAFLALMRELAAVSGGYVILSSHPSLSGIASKSGLSGSTHWHNGVRARAYLHSGKDDDGEPVDPGRRVLEFMKNNYAEGAEKVELEWRNGQFLPVLTPSDMERAAKNLKAETVFLDLLDKLIFENFSPRRTARNYAPTMFARSREAKLAKLGRDDFEIALDRLLADGRVIAEPYDKPSRGWVRLVRRRE